MSDPLREVANHTVNKVGECSKSNQVKEGEISVSKKVKVQEIDVKNGADGFEN